MCIQEICAWKCRENNSMYIMALYLVFIRFTRFNNSKVYFMVLCSKSNTNRYWIDYSYTIFFFREIFLDPITLDSFNLLFNLCGVLSVLFTLIWNSYWQVFLYMYKIVGRTNSSHNWHYKLWSILTKTYAQHSNMFYELNRTKEHVYCIVTSNI